MCLHQNIVTLTFHNFCLFLANKLVLGLTDVPVRIPQVMHTVLVQDLCLAIPVGVIRFLKPSVLVFRAEGKDAPAPVVTEMRCFLVRGHLVRGRVVIFELTRSVSGRVIGNKIQLSHYPSQLLRKILHQPSPILDKSCINLLPTHLTIPIPINPPHHLQNLPLPYTTPMRKNLIQIFSKLIFPSRKLSKILIWVRRTKQILQNHGKKCLIDRLGKLRFTQTLVIIYVVNVDLRLYGGVK